jgi:hypothetical protein
VSETPLKQPFLRLRTLKLWRYKMPVRTRRNPDGTYRVSTPGGVKAKRTTKKKAEAQKRLLNAIEHGFKPSKGKGNR